MNFVNYRNHLGVLTKRVLIRDQGVRSFFLDDAKGNLKRVNTWIQSFSVVKKPAVNRYGYAHRIRAKSDTLDRVMAERERVLAFYFD